MDAALMQPLQQPVYSSMCHVYRAGGLMGIIAQRNDFTTVKKGLLRRVGPRHLPTRRTSPTRRAPTPCTTLYDASYIPDASGPDALYDTVRRVVQCLKQHSAPPPSLKQHSAPPPPLLSNTLPPPFY